MSENKLLAVLKLSSRRVITLFFFLHSIMEQYIIKYHHGGIQLRDEEVKYINWLEVEFTVDPDKLCYWDLLGI